MIKKEYNSPLLWQKALFWANQHEHFVWLGHQEINNYPFGTFKTVLAVGKKRILTSSDNSLDKLLTFQHQKPSWLFGFLNYDLKNEIELLSTPKEDYFSLPHLEFFEPLHLLFFGEKEIEIHSEDALQIWEEIQSQEIKTPIEKKSIEIQASMSYQEYLQKVEKIKQHIIEGDIYEMNFCMDFYAENIELSPITTFLDLVRKSPMPFAALLKRGNFYCLCASPERFLQKKGDKLLSQPIKGTIQRGNSPEEDDIQKNTLLYSPKERSENMMIVDLVRNDLARISNIGSTRVVEMFGIYPFRHLFQMISSIASTLNPTLTFVDAIRACFPMGSMTGAPKIMAMELIEQYENVCRGLFSGAIGYISPECDFDFNVVIRSIFYDRNAKKLAFKVGSAITYNADAMQEYQECILKAKAICEVLEIKIGN